MAVRLQITDDHEGVRLYLRRDPEIQGGFVGTAPAFEGRL